MDLNKQFNAIIDVFKQGLSFNLNANLKQNMLNTIIFCSVFVILILGFPNNAFNGLASWAFKSIYPQYLDMDLFHQFNYERIIWVQLKISSIMSMAIFLSILIWIFISCRINSKILFPNNAGSLFLYIFRWVFAIQFAVMLVIPFMFIKILDINYQVTQAIRQINQIPILMIKTEMLSLAIIFGAFLSNLFYQIKKVLDLIQATPRRWYGIVTQRFAFSVIIPFICGILVSCYFYYLIETDNVLNKNVYLFNSCIYIKQNQKIPSYNGIKAALQEVGCEKYVTCLSITDERLKNNCLIKLYTDSNNFNFLVHNEKRDVCNS